MYTYRTSIWPRRSTYGKKSHASPLAAAHNNRWMGEIVRQNTALHKCQLNWSDQTHLNFFLREEWTTWKDYISGLKFLFSSGKDTFLVKNFFSNLERNISAENPLSTSLLSLLLLFCFKQKPVLCPDHLGQHLKWNMAAHPSESLFIFAKGFLACDMFWASAKESQQNFEAHLSNIFAFSFLNLTHTWKASWVSCSFCISPFWAEGEECRLNIFSFVF